MDRQRYTLLGTMVMMVVAAFIGWWIWAGNSILAIGAMVAAIVIGMGLIYLLGRQVSEVMEDERAYKISEKASRVTFRVSVVAMAAIGAILIALSKSGSAHFAEAGFTLAYAACASLVVYIASYGYYSNRM